MSARLLSPEAPLLGLLVATLLWPLHMVVPLSVYCWWTLCPSMFPLLIRTPVRLYLGAILTASF